METLPERLKENLLGLEEFVIKEMAPNAIIDLFSRITEALDSLFYGCRGRASYDKIFIMLPPCSRRFVDYFMHTNYVFMGNYIQNEVEIDGCRKKLHGYIIRGCNLIFISPTEDAYVFYENWDTTSDYNKHRFKIPIIYSNTTTATGK